MERRERLLVAACLWIAVVVVPASAQDGPRLYRTFCASCHEATGEGAAPPREVMKQLTAEQVLQALEKGVMTDQGAERSRAERRVLAEYVSEKHVGNIPADAIPSSAFCAGSPGSLRPRVGTPVWNGWGVNVGNARFQPAAAARLAAADVPRLTLKWAFGFPGASSASAQPVVFAGRVYVSSWDGEAYALDARSGCIEWMLETEAGVRVAMSIAKRRDGRFAVYFGDLAANIYAVDAETGRIIWKKRIDEYPFARITGSPTFHAGRLYVPVSSREESQVADPAYACCRFRGSVVALDAETGRQIWKTYTVDAAKRTGKSRAAVQLFGPAGVAVWVAPTVDARRGIVYVGTGNDYAAPATRLSDAIVAFDMHTGRIRWARQMTMDDIWNGHCRAPKRDPELCPDADAPDFDFGASPVLVEMKGRRSFLVTANKSGLVMALDPDRGGRTIWQQRVAKGGTQGGILFGPAVDAATVYAPISDFARKGRTPDPNAGGGLAAVDLASGAVRWTAPPVSCGARSPCSPAQAAAATAIPGVVFSGSADGHLRAYASDDGAIIWDYDTVREYATVNGVPARGGSLNNAGAAVVDGMVFANSGYSHHSGVIPGNVLLAFAVEERAP